MGASLGNAASNRTEVLWASDGRSAATRERAELAGLTDAGDLVTLCEQCEIVISVCPPDASLALAQSIAAQSFTGIFVDANAISPSTAEQIRSTVEDGGASFVDGGIIGPPARSHGTTRLYLAGDSSPRVAEIFAGSTLAAVALSADSPAASTLKMCYAAYTKGSSALLIAIRALARGRGVEGPLLDEWGLSIPGLEQRSKSSAVNNAPKAWRFAGEMEEIAATFDAASLPAGFHLAAAEVYRRLSSFKNITEPELDAVLEAVITER